MTVTVGTPWLEVPSSTLKLGSEVASGAGAAVFRAQIVVPGAPGPADVAVRKPRIRSAEALDRFEQEVRLRAALRHPNVLPLLGACTSPPLYCTISPWVAGGNAFDVLHAQGVRFTWRRVLELALQLARGMQYLHSCAILHRDLKTANILLGPDWRDLVIADLDLAVDAVALHSSAAENGGRALGRGPSNGRLRHMVGTLVYLAPEVLRGAPHSFAADVYAFAITINEIAAASVPYVDRKLPVPELHTVLETRFNEVTLRAAITRDHLRPVLALDTPPEFHQLVTACWHPDPAARPSFDSVVAALESLAARGDDFHAQFRAAASTVPERAAAPVNHQLAAEMVTAAARPPLPPVWQAPTAAAYLPAVSAGVAATSGKRGEDRMEDRHVMVEKLGGLADHHLFAVLDGHGGQGCSEMVSELMPGAVMRRWSDPDTTPEATLVHAFEDLDLAFAGATASQDASGSTALTVFIVGDMLYVANAGDCRCILAGADGTARALNTEHVSTNAKEKAMVEARGGSIIDDRVDGLLAITRSLGDLALKPSLTACPEVETVRLGPEHQFLLLASDGVWDVLTPDEAVRLVRTTVSVPDMAAKRVALKALELGSTDNVTCIVIYLTPVDSLSMLTD